MLENLGKILAVLEIPVVIQYTNVLILIIKTRLPVALHQMIDEMLASSD